MKIILTTLTILTVLFLCSCGAKMKKREPIISKICDRYFELLSKKDTPGLLSMHSDFVYQNISEKELKDFYAENYTRFGDYISHSKLGYIEEYKISTAGNVDYGTIIYDVEYTDGKTKEEFLFLLGKDLEKVFLVTRKIASKGDEIIATTKR